ncbi:MAG: hypothetical protein HC927_04385 [Deltaproteobacteria bacterium]|nr:hypothetical protein [Deltaproteobacteria bacterium]
MTLANDIALLIGIEGIREANPLRGTHADLDRIAEILPVSFDIIRVEAHHASRTVILALLRGLVELARGRQILIFFSCHGSILRHGSSEHPFLVTNDHPRPDASFGGVLAVELWVLVATIAERTPFVTLILDCCYAEGIVRGSSARPLPHRRDSTLKRIEPREFPWPAHLAADYPGYASFDDWLAAIPADLLDSNGHPWVIRVSASSPEQPAYECRDASGNYGGLLTRELHELMCGRETPPSWQQAIACVRARIKLRCTVRQQRPEVAGPAARLVFARAHEDITTNAAVEIDGEATWLLSGNIHGTALGDRFATRSASGSVELQVIEVLEDRSRVASLDADARVETGTLAYLRSRARRIPVAVTIAGRRGVRVRMLIASSPLLALSDSPASASLLVTMQGRSLAISDGTARVICLTTPDRLLIDLDVLARARRFAATCERSPGLPEFAGWTHRTFRGRATMIDELHGGELVEVGDRLWFEFINTSRCATRLYFNVVGLGVNGRARCHNQHYALAGLPAPANATRALHRRLGAPAGYRVDWPVHAPSDRIREFQLIFIASNRPVDLRAVMGVRAHEPLACRGEARSPVAFAWACRTLTLRLAPLKR